MPPVAVDTGNQCVPRRFSTSTWFKVTQQVVYCFSNAMFARALLHVWVPCVRAGGGSLCKAAAGSCKSAACAAMSARTGSRSVTSSFSTAAGAEVRPPRPWCSGTAAKGPLQARDEGWKKDWGYSAAAGITTPPRRGIWQQEYSGGVKREENREEQPAGGRVSVRTHGSARSQVRSSVCAI